MSGADPGPVVPRGLGEIIVTFRPADEYRAMFDLPDAELGSGPILDCRGARARSGRGCGPRAARP